MLEVLKVIIFGIVEGITEWLPISSTGHTQRSTGTSDPAGAAVAAQTGSGLSGYVLCGYPTWRDTWQSW